LIVENARLNALLDNRDYVLRKINKRQDGEVLGATRLVREVVRMRGRLEISQSHQKPTTKMSLFLNRIILGTD
jgi:hypothetical protein